MKSANETGERIGVLREREGNKVVKETINYNGYSLPCVF
jgi:hypothetical protein